MSPSAIIQCLIDKIHKPVIKMLRYLDNMQELV